MAILRQVAWLTGVVCQLTACGQPKSFDEKVQSLYRHTVPQISVAQLAADLEKSADVVVLDCREPAEYAVSHLPGATFAGYKKFDLNDWQLAPDTKIVVYCSVGYRSERIGEKLQKAGYRNVFNLYGGIFHWMNEGRPVYNPQNQPTNRIHTYSKNWSQWVTTGEKIYD